MLIYSLIQFLEYFRVKHTIFDKVLFLIAESVAAESIPSTEASLKYVPGWFSCPVVWETNFTMHPRLKTGPTKPGMSRGIQALRTVLNRFSVSNRNNMFVYQDHSANVFYLRYANVLFPYLLSWFSIVFSLVFYSQLAFNLI